MRPALPRYFQKLHQQLLTRNMAGTDKIAWRAPQWRPTQDIPTFLSLLIAFARTQLAALAGAEELNAKEFNIK
jgi:hypothetical protein